MLETTSLSPRGNRALRACWAASIVGLAALVAHASLGFGDARVDAFFEDWLFTALYVVPTAICIARAILVAHERTVWLMFALALAAVTAGALNWTLFLRHVDPLPYPSSIGVLSLLFYPAVYAGLVLLLRARVGDFHRSLWLDGVIGTLALAAVAAALVFEPVRESTGRSASAVATNLAYPLGSLLLLGFTITLFAMTSWRPGRVLFLVGTALAIQVVTDCTYLYQTATGTFSYRSVVGAGWLAVMLLVAYAAWQTPSKRPRLALQGWPVLLFPVLFTLVAIAMLVYGNFRELNWLATSLATATLLVGAARTSMTFVEMRTLARSREEALAAALTDNLTGLRNHRAFHEDLARELARTKRSGSTLAVVMLDLERLKWTNDRFGHQAGDERLKAVAAWTKETVRAGDAVYRLGGDEFAVILPGENAWGAFQAAQRLQARCAATSIGGATVAAGVAETSPGFAKDTLLRQADLALIDAKRSHRKVVVYSEALEPQWVEPDGDGRRQHLKMLATSLARAVDAKDSYTRSHCETVAETCVLIARELGLEQERVASLRLAGLLHDVGKIGIPDEILHKPGKLTGEEYEVMKTHATLGYSIVSGAGLEDEARWILHHHERLDGDGYPDGLREAEIRLESRIIHVADAFEAMTSDRPYRSGLPEEQALAELRAHAGTQFDAECVDALGRAIGKQTEGLRLAPSLPVA